MVGDNDLWEGGNAGSDQEDYVLVKQEDIVEGIACFMAAYLISLKQTKVCDLAKEPNWFFLFIKLKGLILVRAIFGVCLYLTMGAFLGSLVELFV